MKRSVGVTLSAVIVLLGSVLTLLLGLVVAAIGLMPTDPRIGALRPLFLVEAVIFGVVAVLGMATGVDLFRLRRWARISLIVFAAFLCLTGFTAGGMMLVIPLPAPANAPAGFARTMMGVRLGIAGFYFLLLALGGWWIWLFTRAGVKAQFEMTAASPRTAGVPAGAPAASRVGVAQGRPVSITIIAVLILMGSLSFPAMLLLRFPAYVFGNLIDGWGAVTFYLGFSAAHLAIGMGLLKLRPWSRLAAIGIYLFGLLNTATMLLPGRMEALMELTWSRFPAVMRPPVNFPMPPVWFTMAPGIVMMAVILYFLVREREAFGKRVPSTG